MAAVQSDSIRAIHPRHGIAQSKASTYIETFDEGPSGWYGFIDNFQQEKALQVTNGIALSHSPWWIDYNHAPPSGTGYLHLVMGLYTRGPFSERLSELTGVNRFVQLGCSTNFTNARLTVRMKGELELRGAQLVLLVQSTIDRLCSGWMLTGQPLEVTRDWSEQTITCVPDERQWKCLGTRESRADRYGTLPLDRVLSDVNTNIFLVLFPLNVASMGPVLGNPHELRAGRDYPVWQSRLPEGYVMIDSIRIDFS